MVKRLILLLLVCLCVGGCGKDSESKVPEEPVSKEEVLQSGTVNFYGETYTREGKVVSQVSNNGLSVEDTDGNMYEVFLMSSSNFKIWSKAIAKDLGKLQKLDNGYCLDTEDMHVYIKKLDTCYLVFLSETLTSDILATK